MARNLGLSRIRELQASPPSRVLPIAGFKISASQLGISSASRLSFASRFSSMSSRRFSSEMDVQQMFFGKS